MRCGDDVLERPHVFMKPVHAGPTTPYVHWPIAPDALEALVDLGMSDEVIADYFHVKREAVVRLRREVRLEAA